MDGLGQAKGERFTREDRLVNRRDFDAVYSRGARIPGRYFVLLILQNQLGRSRLGVTLSRKVGNAVTRNQARRRLREVFRRRRDQMCAGLDIVVHAHPEIAKKPLELLKAEFLAGIARFEQQGKRRK